MEYSLSVVFLDFLYFGCYLTVKFHCDVIYLISSFCDVTVLIYLICLG